METITEFWIAAATIALGQGLGANMAFMTPIMYWFNKKRGTASSMVAMGRGWGYIGAIPIAWVIVHYGWRQAALWAAIVFFCLSFPTSFFLRRKPEPYGYLPDGVPLPPGEAGATARKVAQTSSDEGSFTVRQALRTPAFWFILLGNLTYSFSTSTNHVHIANHIRSTGFTIEAAAVIVSIYGVVQVISRVLCGPLGDRVGRNRLLMLSHVFMGLGWVAIAFISPANTFWAVPLYLIFYGLGQAAYTVTSQTMVADYFGPRRYATLRGIMNPITVIGGVTGPLAAGIMFDRWDSYTVPFLIMAPLIAAGAIAIKLAGKPMAR